MSHCAQLSSALSSLSSMPPTPPHTHTYTAQGGTLPYPHLLPP